MIAFLFTQHMARQLSLYSFFSLNITPYILQVDDGWCEGSYGGKKGMFPDNFVQLKPATAPPPAATATKAMARPPPPDPQPSSDPAPIDPPIVTRPAGIVHCLFYG